MSMKSLEGPTVEMESTAEPLIPGLPDEVAEECLLRLPFPHSAAGRAVSAAWRRALLRASPAAPHLFVLASAPDPPRLRLLALNPCLRRWLTLPCTTAADSPLAASAILGRRGLLLLGAADAPVLTYRAETNSWTAAAPTCSPSSRAFVSAFTVDGRIYAAAAGSDGQISSIARYCPEAKLWTSGAPLRRGISRYDAVALGSRIYITEGWAWPFIMRPRGAIYDVDSNTWMEMPPGMVEGWTGAAAVVGGRVFVVSETGEGRVKVYSEEADTWREVSGGGVLSDVRKPFVVAGGDEDGGRVYVVGSGLDVGVGKLVENGIAFRIEWEVVKGPPDSADLNPFSAHLLFV